MFQDKKIKRIVIVFFIISALGGCLFGYITSRIKYSTGIDNLRRFQPSMPTRLYDVNGDLIAELFQEKRELVAFEDLPPSLINAFVATEDQGFFNHHGIDPPAIFRAAIKNLFASIRNLRPTVVQGGSTITQQLAKRLFTSGERNIARKVLEAVLAFQIEKDFTKEEILEMYFNQIYLGHGCHGIATASRFFFNKDIRYMTVFEGSILAAMPSRPSGFSPLRNPHEAVEKNWDTLSRMVDCRYITRDYAIMIYGLEWPRYLDDLKTEFPTKTAISKNIDYAPYFTDYVRQILVARFGKDMVYNEGLMVYTTLNLKRQLAAEKYLREGVERQNEVSSRFNLISQGGVDRSLFGAYDVMRTVFALPAVMVKNDLDTQFRKMIADEVVDTGDLLTLVMGSDPANEGLEGYRALVADISSTQRVEGALIAVEPSTGYITSMVGGSEFQVSNQYNRAVQARRQPGSSFKPFIYGSAIEDRAISAATMLPDAPIVDIDAQGVSWSPGNYEGDFSGMVSIRRALAASINIISVRIYDLIGPDKVIEYASRLLKVPESRFTPGPSLALGTTEVTPFEMATGYSIYANRGRDVIPFAIRYVTDRDGGDLDNTEEEVGRIIALKEADGSIQVIGEDLDYIMTSLMRGVVDHGTAAETIRATARFDREAAGKTGTTSNWTDAWFCGFTPDITTVVWIGYDRPFMSLGKHQAGASVAAPIWARYMKDIYNGMPDSHFAPEPPGVIRTGVCRYTGMIPGPGCTEINGDLGLPGCGGGKICNGNHYTMKSVLDRYMENEGLVNGE